MIPYKKGTPTAKITFPTEFPYTYTTTLTTTQATSMTPKSPTSHIKSIYDRLDVVRDKISIAKLDFNLQKIEYDFYDIEYSLKLNAQIADNNLKYLEKVKTNRDMINRLELVNAYVTVTAGVMLIGTFGYATWILYKMLGFKSENYKKRRANILARKLRKKKSVKKTNSTPKVFLW